MNRGSLLLSSFRNSQHFCNPSCDMNATGRGVRKRMGHAGTVATDVKAFVIGLQILVQLHFHVVELDLHAI